MEELLESIKKSLESKNWYAALSVALIIPDICGNIDSPGIGSRKRYIEWYNRYIYEYLKQNYTVQGKGALPFLTGGDCYAIRCAMLHEFSEDLTTHKAKEIIDNYRFRSPDTCRFGTSLQFKDSGNQMEINVKKFCEWIRIGVNIWYQESGHSEDEINSIVEIW